MELGHEALGGVVEVEVDQLAEAPEAVAEGVAVDVDLFGGHDHVAERVEVGPQRLGVGGAVLGVVGQQGGDLAPGHVGAQCRDLAQLEEEGVGPDLVDGRHPPAGQPRLQQAQDPVGVVAGLGHLPEAGDGGADPDDEARRRGPAGPGR